ncbi:MAG: polysaccharide deacetylase family protein [Candidatus Margulisiibacteriota bacterium]
MRNVFVLAWVLLGLLCVAFPSYRPSGLVNFVPTKKNIVFLTFDDGPLPVYTEQTLAILASENVKATFHLIGNNMVKYPDLVERIRLAGHDVGNHSFNHIRLDNLIGKNLDFEIEETSKVIQDILGGKPRFFRPPGGRFNSMILEVVHRNNLIPIGWAVNTSDFLESNQKKLTAEQVEQKVVEVVGTLRGTLHPGSIILMHTGNLVTLKALPLAIRLIKESGFQIGKLSDAL